MIALIWAQARDAAGRPVIGAGNTIPWRVSEDFARFRALTSGHPVVMGRRTWDSFPRRPLPGRTNIVITRQAGWSSDGATVAGGLPAALALAAAAPGADVVWVIGGGQVYAEVLAAGVVDRLEVTEIDLEVAGDAFAPDVDAAAWREVAATEAGGGAGGGGLPATPSWRTPAADDAPRYRFRTYVRR